MENKNTVNKNEVKAIEKVEMEKTAIEEKELKLFVGRESFVGTAGKQYWAYVLKGNVRGREVKVNFIPKDIGGYEPLDIVFSIKDTAELIMTTETMTDTNGKSMSYVSYKVRNEDELGILECGVKPSRDSDKALLIMIVNQLKATAKK